LEGYAARLAAENMTKQDLDNLSSTIKKMEDAAGENDFLAFMDSHYDFHRIYIKTSRNNLLIKSLEDLLNQSLWFRFAFLYFHEAYGYSIKKHKEILRLFARKDKEKVETVMRQHIETGMKRFLEFLEA
jgi:DNA-binding GntR family transcriptional regulator